MQIASTFQSYTGETLTHVKVANYVDESDFETFRHEHQRNRTEQIKKQQDMKTYRSHQCSNLTPR